MVTAPWRVASSVIIISCTTGRLLMMQRGPTAKFMPNAFVFPGGVLSPSDETMGPATKIAALREAFEETGLCVTEKGVESAAGDTRLAGLQDEVNKDPAAFKKVLEKTAVEQLVPWSAWLTPTSYPKRFMTSFFLLPVDGEPEVRMCEREMTAHGWELPSAWLKITASGGSLPPPQTYELMRLSQIPTGEWARFAPVQKMTFTPQKVFWDDGVHITNLLPGDHLYINENSEHAPARTMSTEEITVRPDKPTHRIQYEKNMWARSSVYQHNIEESFKSMFIPFETSSKYLSKL